MILCLECLHTSMLSIFGAQTLESSYFDAKDALHRRGDSECEALEPFLECRGVLIEWCDDLLFHSFNV